MASGIGAIGNLLGKVNASNALVVTLSGGAATASLLTVTVDGLVTTSTDGVVVQDTTAATVGVPVQLSPRVRTSGTAWDTDDSVSRTVSFFTETLPVSGTGVTGTWRLGFIAPVGGAITYPLTVTSAGALTTLTSIFATTSIQLGAAQVFGWNGLSRFVSGTNGLVQFTNNGDTAGVGLDFATDAAIKIRTRAQSAFATLHGFLRDVRTETPEATDGNATYTTAQVLGGIITRSNMGSNRVDAFPTAANLVAAIPGCSVGTSFDVIVNNNDTAQTVTVNGASTGITYEGTATAIAATECRLFRVLVTNVTGAAEAATVFQVV